MREWTVMALDRDPGGMLPEHAAIRWCAWVEGSPGYYAEGPTEAAVLDAVRAKVSRAMGGATPGYMCRDCGELVGDRTGGLCARCHADTAWDEGERKDDSRAQSMGGDRGGVYGKQE